MSKERFDTVVIGAGQAGLAIGYHLARQRSRFVIVDAGDWVGQSWEGLNSPAGIRQCPTRCLPLRSVTSEK